MKKLIQKSNWKYQNRIKEGKEPGNPPERTRSYTPTPPRTLGSLTETILQAGFQVYLDLGYGDHCSAYDSKLSTGAAMIPSLSLSFQLTGTT